VAIGKVGGEIYFSALKASLFLAIARLLDLLGVVEGKAVCGPDAPLRYRFVLMSRHYNMPQVTPTSNNNSQFSVAFLV
jgi:hypothetical protein